VKSKLNLSTAKPEALEAIYIMKSSDEWDRFIRFMTRYGEENGLELNKLNQNWALGQWHREASALRETSASVGSLVPALANRSRRRLRQERFTNVVSRSVSDRRSIAASLGIGNNSFPSPFPLSRQVLQRGENTQRTASHFPL
jgi:hypothetical protein